MPARASTGCYEDCYKAMIVALGLLPLSIPAMAGQIVWTFNELDLQQFQYADRLLITDTGLTTYESFNIEITGSGDGSPTSRFSQWPTRACRATPAGATPVIRLMSIWSRPRH
jgi:hypothetical protein